MSSKLKLMRAASLAALFFFLNLFFLFPANSSAAIITGGGVNRYVVTQINGIRFGANDERERLVIELGQVPEYTINSEMGGKRYVLELKGVSKRNGKMPTIKGRLIRNVSCRKTPGSHIITIDLKEAAAQEIISLVNPARLVVDFYPLAEKEKSAAVAQGIHRIDYVKRTMSGSVRGYILTVDPMLYRLDPVLAGDVVPGRATVSAMAREYGAVAAINGGYFDWDGTILGMLRIGGKLAGTGYQRRTAVGFREDGTGAIGPVEYTGRVTIHSAMVPVSGVNTPRENNSLVIYNSYYGKTTSTDKAGREFTVVGNKVVDIRQCNSLIPENGYVISVSGRCRDAYTMVRKGDTVTFYESISTGSGAWGQAAVDWRNIPDIIGAGPQLVANGRVSVTKTEEQFPADIAKGRAPRTAIGLKSDGTWLLAVVDGRQTNSIGMTLEELAELMVKYGAKTAVNLDGGGSSEMVVNNQIINSPSDGNERQVGSGIVITRR
ncbi:MAG: phosphodiester glycosidase family protein [Selenomonadaceae bacterium]|nr:phosphodiester glycosidase family protein [Selenomonadaceae bacterium]